ncbi:dipeptidase [Sandaracinobacteroides saxicola]|uniref:Membrane dipeptidase n=1 Tax=Sandaracinobacteroides saxicola TaxID=2759707 RepID=A0A7G5IK99_9SPHN|nr:membrane dipeptidase [Sandaracinobacteroides saxicola]QMW23791.1 membrane dipeptidase [Sandaracinobacteroides saxicola]
MVINTGNVKRSVQGVNMGSTMLPVWDNHACMPLRANDGVFLPQLERARDNGVSVISLNIGAMEQTPEEHRAVLRWFRQWLGERGDAYRIVSTPDDIAIARAEGRMSVMFDIEGARGIGDRLESIADYYALGVRWMLIAYNRENLAGYGCYDEEDLGLKPFGRDMIREMNAAGMTVCCSHTGERTARDVLDASSRPVIFSHSNCGALHAHKRNISDAMIRACAAQGGVVGINGIGDFLCGAGKDIVEAFVAHVDHAVQLVGPDHVGLSLDYCYDMQELLDYLETMKHSFPEGFSPEIRMVAPEDLPAIVSGLRRRGYDDGSLAKILHDNWLRIARQNWR